MIELQITLQILGIIVLVLLAVALGYVVSMLAKISRKLDSILEIVTFYEKVRDIVGAFFAGPGKTYVDIVQTVLGLVSPKLTKSREDK